MEFARPILIKGIGNTINISSKVSSEANAEKIDITNMWELYLKINCQLSIINYQLKVRIF